MGIPVGNTMAYAATAKGVRDSNAAYKMSFNNYSNSRTVGVTGTTGFFGKSGTSGKESNE